jgi:hypothetical protein
LANTFCPILSDELLDVVRRSRFLIKDRNLVRNKGWESALDRTIKFRTDEGINADLMIPVDTLCHRIPHFIEECT